MKAPYALHWVGTQAQVCDAARGMAAADGVRRRVQLCIGATPDRRCWRIGEVRAR